MGLGMRERRMRQLPQQTVTVVVMEEEEEEMNSRETKWLLLFVNLELRRG